MDEVVPADGPSSAMGKKENLEDSFFADDPYIGHTHRTGRSGTSWAAEGAPPFVAPEEACAVEHNPNANIGLQMAKLERQPSFVSECEQQNYSKKKINTVFIMNEEDLDDSENDE